MRFFKNADFDYSSNAISESNGYTKWYDWSIVKKQTRILNIIIMMIIVVFAFSLRRTIREMTEITTLIFIMISGTVIWLLVITPIHEILHLIPLSKGVLDNKCVISVGRGSVSAIYNGHTNLYQQLISLILPFAVFLVLLGSCTVFTSGNTKIFFVYLLLLSSYGSYTDIYMFFYCLKHIGKDDVIFGLYKKNTGQ